MEMKLIKICICHRKVRLRVSFFFTLSVVHTLEACLSLIKIIICLWSVFMTFRSDYLRYHFVRSKFISIQCEWSEIIRRSLFLVLVTRK